MKLPLAFLCFGLVPPHFFLYNVFGKSYPNYFYQAKPRSLEMIVDEMLAIRTQIEGWREKKESREAQASYNARLFARRGKDEDEE